MRGSDAIRDQEQAIYPDIDLDLGPQWEFNFGVGFGLTRQGRFVAASLQPDILRAHNVGVAICAEQSANDIVIEILVRQPTQNGY